MDWDMQLYSGGSWLEYNVRSPITHDRPGEKSVGWGNGNTPLALSCAPRWITRSGSVWLIWLLSNDRPTRCSAGPDRGAAARARSGGSLPVQVVKGSQLSQCVCDGGEVNSSSVYTEGADRSKKGFIAGGNRFQQRRFKAFGRIKEHNKVLLFSELRCKPWRREPYWAILCLLRATSARHYKYSPSSPVMCVGRGSSVASFCSPTQPIITVQSTNNSWFISATAQLETLWAMSFGSHAVRSTSLPQPQNKWSVNSGPIAHFRGTRFVVRLQLENVHFCKD